MDVTPLVPKGASIIESYGPGRFSIAGQRHQGAVLVLPMRVLPWAPAAPPAPGDFAPLVDADIEILLLGTGPALVFPGPALKAHFRERGIALEVMDTGAACRTWNLLLSEGRRAAAALLPA